MTTISFARHQFPPAIIRHAVWLYFRFTLSLRDVEELLAERGIDVSYETIRCWTMKFGTAIAANEDCHLVKMPPRGRSMALAAKLSGKQRPKLQNPAPNGLVGDI